MAGRSRTNLQWPERARTIYPLGRRTILVGRTSVRCVRDSENFDDDVAMFAAHCRFEVGGQFVGGLEDRVATRYRPGRSPRFGDQFLCANGNGTGVDRLSALLVPALILGTRIEIVRLPLRTQIVGHGRREQVRCAVAGATSVRTAVGAEPRRRAASLGSIEVRIDANDVRRLRFLPISRPRALHNFAKARIHQLLASLAVFYDAKRWKVRRGWMGG